MLITLNFVLLVYFFLSGCSSSHTQPCSLQPLKEAISVLFSFTRRVLDDSQFQADIHHWLERLVYKTATSHTLHSSGFISSHGSDPLSRWQSCCMLEDQESTCICCAIFCAVPLGWGSGRHPSFRLVSIIFIFVMLLLCVQMSRFFFPIIVSDSGQIQPLWHTTLYASFSHPNVTCQSPCRVSGPHETL